MAAKAIDKQRSLLGLPPQNISRIGFVCPGSYGEMSVFAEEKTGIGMMDRPSFDNSIAELKYLKKQNPLPVYTREEYPYMS